MGMIHNILFFWAQLAYYLALSPFGALLLGWYAVTQFLERGRIYDSEKERYVLKLKPSLILIGAIALLVVAYPEIQKNENLMARLTEQNDPDPTENAP